MCVKFILIFSISWVTRVKSNVKKNFRQLMIKKWEKCQKKIFVIGKFLVLQRVLEKCERKVDKKYCTDRKFLNLRIKIKPMSGICVIGTYSYILFHLWLAPFFAKIQIFCVDIMPMIGNWEEEDIANDYLTSGLPWNDISINRRPHPFPPPTPTVPPPSSCPSPPAVPNDKFFQ